MESVSLVQWVESPPSSPGFYWFFGDTSYGSMGGHFTGVIPPHIKLHFVEITKISNGLSAVAEGRFIPMTKYDPNVRKEGHVGVWAKATLPEVPDEQVIARLCQISKEESNE